MDARKLDWSRLLGFDQSPETEVDLRGTTPAERLEACAELGAKVGGKIGSKNSVRPE